MAGVNRAELPELVLPSLVEVVPSANPDDPTDEEDIIYNSWCNQHINAFLSNIGRGAMCLTRYPSDTVTETIDSRDVVTLDETGAVVIVESEMI